MEFSCKKCGEKNLIEEENLEILKKKESVEEKDEPFTEESLYVITLGGIYSDEDDKLLFSDTEQSFNFLSECKERVAYFCNGRKSKLSPIAMRCFMCEKFFSFPCKIMY